MSRESVSSFDSILNSSNLTEREKKFLSKLSDEQKKIVVDDSKYTLVRSAAGGGKTTLLIAKYLYLTRIKGVPKDRIKYLSFNKKNVEDTKRKMSEECGIEEEEREHFADTFHALALNIIGKSEDCWPKLLEPVYKVFSKNDEIDHVSAAAYLSSFQDELNLILKDPKNKFKVDILKELIRYKGHYPHQYVTFYCDRNGTPGSCRSKQERDIFEFLAKKGIDFAYEEIDRKNHCRPDFTIYLDNGEKIIYEHFASDSLGSNAHREKYERDKEAKKRIYEKENHFIYTIGTDNKTKKILEIDSLGPEILDKLEKKCKSLNTSVKRIDVPSVPKLWDDYLELIIEIYKDVRNLIIESGQDINSVKERLCSKSGYIGFFMSFIFTPLEERYSKILLDKGVVTDFSDSIKRATQHLCNPGKKEKLSAICYDYVLVDEFQDISKARHDLLIGLRQLYPAMRLLAVGDDWQSIYSFTCSDLSYFRDFSSYWPKAKMMDLSETYRFGDDILSKASKFVQKDKNLSIRTLKSSSNRKTYLSVWEANACIKKEERKTQWMYIVEELKKYQNKDVVILSRFDKEAKGVERWLNDTYSLKHDKEKKLDCLTIHKAKGLTADIVFVQNCDKYSVPYVKDQRKLSDHDKLLHMIRKDKDGNEGYLERRNEERRLFYVALTRAREKVYLLYDKDCKSDFIDELGL